MSGDIPLVGFYSLPSCRFPFIQLPFRQCIIFVGTIFSLQLSPLRAAFLCPAVIGCSRGRFPNRDNTLLYLSRLSDFDSALEIRTVVD